MRRTARLAALLVLACAPSSSDPPATTPRPQIDPAATQRPAVRVPPREEPVERLAPPEVAHAHGWMPRSSTGADRFVRAHPTYDGRGVLIAILDTGVDPGVPGLRTTSTGEPKVLDVRDFSGEGEVPLTALTPRGDTAVIAGRALGGFGRVVALGTAGPYFGGVLPEPALGALPSSDLNGDGDAADSLALVVVRATDGWAVLADTDGDGSLAGERPVRDYLVSRETFGWAPRGRAPRVNLAPNLVERDGRPALELVFALDAHGTHVAGIAAANDLYGVSGFDGVAPGAQLLALKISNRANGSVSGRGSILAAVDHAVRFAAERRRPLVINLSFGVGNEREGAARIDRLIDSVLARHPELPLVVSAGNDGPGLSTIGFPGSATRAISVGGTIPAAFLPPDQGEVAADIMADFSARGGELAKPDIVAPAVAYSSVPLWNAGDEVKQGTSMAAPHVAGLTALLLSAMTQERRAVDARSIRQALMVTARPARYGDYLDEGRGLPDVGAAYDWLAGGGRAPAIEVREAGERTTAAWVVADEPGEMRGSLAFEISRPADAPSATYILRSDVPWLTAPKSVTLTAPLTRLELRYTANDLARPGAYTAVVSAWPSDTLAGPAFRLVSTILRPAAVADSVVLLRRDVPVEAGGALRSFFRADSARPFELRVATLAGQQGIAYLHEPGGAPFRENRARPLGSGEQQAVYRVDARDVVPGAYQAVAIPAPSGRLAVTVAVAHAPVTVHAHGEREVAVAELRNLTAGEVGAVVELRLRGAQRVDTVYASGSAIQRVPFTIPAWAVGLEVDVRMDPAQWTRFTDFGVTVLDSLGRQVAQDPMEYAFGRLSTVLPSGHGGTDAMLTLYPGFAEAGDEREWSVTTTIRLYGDSAVTADPLDASGELTLAARSSGSSRFRLPPSPWPLPAGFAPLGVVLVRQGDRVWTRESGFAEGTGQ
ncbi:MAG TPA: S8 family serine peptidase [Gemmatimonadales bacterium]|nr:S8 family serine peptidase [Gemmatimonadales bacterium]